MPVTAGTCLRSHQANGLTDLQALKIVADTYLFEKEKSGIGIKIGENQALTLSLSFLAKPAHEGIPATFLALQIHLRIQKARITRF